ncbi:MAG: diacylglycerol kinase family lipid kinase [Cyclobacteriaceae bacterium]|nr:diacylglycerol kinase family lipid kinase [Cyclobacteriaceae bacterium]
MGRNYLFINNPISGGGKNNFIEIFEPLKDQFPQHKIIDTTHGGHAKELANKYKNKYDVIVAVGGDGTINEIASALANSNTSLGIIPCGSGNGFSLHIGISLKVSVALEQLLKGTPKPIDIVTANNQLFVNVAGVGFDGHVASLFNQTKLRGFFSYAKLIFTEYFRYKEYEYSLTIGKKVHKGSAFIIAFANTTQYGNNFRIAPNAVANDGILNIILIKKPPFIRLPYFIYLVFSGKTIKSSYCSELTGSKMTLHFPAIAYHLDGEVYKELNTEQLDFEVLKGALKVIY